MDVRTGVATRLIDRIPLEVLQEIFLQCLVPLPVTAGLQHPWDDLLKHTPSTAPLLLCQIGRSWRQAAISFPNIWTSLNVFVSRGKAQPSAPLATTWLARSGSLPLSLSVHQVNGLDDNSITAREIVEIFQRYTSRWCNIHLDLNTPITQNMSTPMLKEFSIRECSSSLSHQNLLDLPKICASAPCLSNLRVSIPNLNFLYSKSIPWFQLSFLSLGCIPSVSASLYVLDNCHNLTNVYFNVDSLSGPFPFTRVCHHKLRSLSINIGLAELSLFLEYVTFPELIQATFLGSQWPSQYNGWPQTKLEEFLERSRCKLVHLEMQETGMSYTDFAACVCHRSLQSLVRFILMDTRNWEWDPVVTDQAIGLLTCPSSALGGPFLPNLEVVSIKGTLLRATDGMAAKMVESRWRFYHLNGFKKLKRVELEMPWHHHKKDRQRLNEFYDEGLELDLEPSDVVKKWQ